MRNCMPSGFLTRHRQNWKRSRGCISPFPAFGLPGRSRTEYTMLWSSSPAFRLDMMRGVKQKNFWVMEQLSGPTGSWMPMGPTPRPGQIKGYAMQAMAHGADTVMHFRWRTANKGAEMYWHGLIDHSNVPGRRFNEFAELCRLAPKLSVIETTELVSDVAILYSPDNDTAFRI